MFKNFEILNKYEYYGTCKNILYMNYEFCDTEKIDDCFDVELKYEVKSDTWFIRHWKKFSRKKIKYQTISHKDLEKIRNLSTLSHSAIEMIFYTDETCPYLSKNLIANRILTNKNVKWGYNRAWDNNYERIKIRIEMEKMYINKIRKNKLKKILL